MPFNISEPNLICFWSFLHVLLANIQTGLMLWKDYNYLFWLYFQSYHILKKRNQNLTNSNSCNTRINPTIPKSPYSLKCPQKKKAEKTHIGNADVTGWLQCGMKTGWPAWLITAPFVYDFRASFLASFNESGMAACVAPFFWVWRHNFQCITRVFNFWKNAFVLSHLIPTFKCLTLNIEFQYFLKYRIKICSWMNAKTIWTDH